MLYIVNNIKVGYMYMHYYYGCPPDVDISFKNTKYNSMYTKHVGLLWWWWQFLSIVTNDESRFNPFQPHPSLVESDKTAKHAFDTAIVSMQILPRFVNVLMRTSVPYFYCIAICDGDKYRLKLFTRVKHRIPVLFV